MILDDSFSFKYFKNKKEIFRAYRINPNEFEVKWCGGKVRYFEDIVIEALENGIWIKVWFNS